MQKYLSSSQSLGHNDLFFLFSHATSKVDIDDISLTVNALFKSFARDDLLIKSLVSLFTPYKNLRSVEFNLGRMCWKLTSSHFTINSHNDDTKESLSSALSRLFSRALVVVTSPERDIAQQKQEQTELTSDCFSREVKKDVTQNGDEFMLARVDDDDTIVIVYTVVAFNDEEAKQREEDLREESKSSFNTTTTGTKTLLFLARCKISGNDPNGE